MKTKWILGTVLLVLSLLLLWVYWSPEPAGPTVSWPGGSKIDGGPALSDQVSWGMSSDLEKVRLADESILFIGNSHTSFHDLPNLICKMIQSRHPEKKVYSHVIGVTFLEDVARNPLCKQEVESRPWKHVVLQAQKISASGRFEYSRQEGIDFAKLAKAQGAKVWFYCEWGLQGVANDGSRNEKIYQEMADAAKVDVIPVARAWDWALEKQPNLPLYEPDGNHQSATGAFLTACVLAGKISGESPVPWGSFSYLDMSEKDRQFLAKAAEQACLPLVRP